MDTPTPQSPNHPCRPVSFLVLCAATFAPLVLAAATPAPSPTAPPAGLQATQPAPPEDLLPKLVAELSSHAELSAKDCAQLAQETIIHGQTSRQTGQPAKPGVFQDGLAAVDRGESLDAKAADWANLRSQLEELLKPPPPQDQQKDDKKQEEQKKDEQQNESDQQKEQDQQEKQDQQSKDSPKPQEQEQSGDQKSEQPRQPEPQPQEQQDQETSQQKADEPKPPEKPQETQTIGGEKPADDELREHPELAVPLQKLDQVRDQDSPAELFQLLHNDEPRPADQPKKDW